MRAISVVDGTHAVHPGAVAAADADGAFYVIMLLKEYAEM